MINVWFNRCTEEVGFGSEWMVELNHYTLFWCGKIDVWIDLGFNHHRLTKLNHYNLLKIFKKIQSNSLIYSKD